MENREKPRLDEEIDLTQLLARIGFFFKGLGISFLKFLAFIRKAPITHKWLFLGLVLSFGVGAWAYSNLLKKNLYESTLILSSNYINNRIVENSIKKLSKLAAEVSPTGLAKTLIIPDSLASAIIGFSSKPFVSETELIELEVLKQQLKNTPIAAENSTVIDEIIKKIEIENKHAFEIKIITLNPSIAKDLEIPIVNYFRNNQYVKKRIEANEAAFLSRKEKIIRESRKLDSLKNILYENFKSFAEKNRQGSNNVILNDKQMANPLEVFVEDLNLHKELQTIESALYLRSDFELIDGVTEFSKPAGLNNLQFILLSLLVAIGVFYLIIFLMRTESFLQKIEGE